MDEASEVEFISCTPSRKKLRRQAILPDEVIELPYLLEFLKGTPTVTEDSPALSSTTEQNLGLDMPDSSIMVSMSQRPRRESNFSLNHPPEGKFIWNKSRRYRSASLPVSGYNASTILHEHISGSARRHSYLSFTGSWKAVGFTAISSAHQPTPPNSVFEHEINISDRSSRKRKLQYDGYDLEHDEVIEMTGGFSAMLADIDMFGGIYGQKEASIPAIDMRNPSPEILDTAAVVISSLEAPDISRPLNTPVINISPTTKSDSMEAIAATRSLPTIMNASGIVETRKNSKITDRIFDQEIASSSTQEGTASANCGELCLSSTTDLSRQGATIITKVPAALAPEESISPKTTTIQLPGFTVQQHCQFDEPSTPATTKAALHSSMISPTSSTTFTISPQARTSGRPLPTPSVSNLVGTNTPIRPVTPDTSDLMRRPTLYKVTAWPPLKPASTVVQSKPGPRKHIFKHVNVPGPSPTRPLTNAIAVATSATQPTTLHAPLAHIPPSQVLKTSCQGHRKPPSRRRPHKHSPNLLVDIAETCQTLLPIEAIAARHNVSLQKVYDTFSAAVQLPLLKHMDNRRHGELGKKRLIDFREAKKRMEMEKRVGGV
ncbi:hypothetical protein BJ878DRAFT_484242 [Calycina marina]|uniref:Uncharacterized protein n=1 Tax=Calycina marina TaxID=1763456 RepID=A0A9P7YUN7_9HELO|nr:hypothetical protein BJ878DRAFT_484242 [Calycina marina]